MIETILVTTLGTVLTTLVSWGLLELKNYIASKTKNENLNNAATYITTTTAAVVKDLTQSVASYYKEQNADGKLTKDQRTALMNMAKAKVKAQLPETIQKLSGLATDALNDMIASRVESSIHDLK